MRNAFIIIKKIIIWIIWDFSGLHLIYQKIVPPKDGTKKSKPPSFCLWFLSVYVILFGLASQRFEHKRDRIEEKINIVIVQLGTNNKIQALSRLPEIQKMSLPKEPFLLYPDSIWYSLVSEMDSNKEIINITKDIVLVQKRNLEGVNFSKIDLSGLDLSNSNLQKANLTDANLKNVNFSGANLTNARLSGANVRETYFSNAILIKTRFSESNLEKALFPDANLEEAWFYRSNLKFVDFSNANLRKTLLIETNLEGTCFYNANLEYTDLSGSNLKNVDLTVARLKDVKLPDEKKEIGIKRLQNIK